MAPRLLRTPTAVGGFDPVDDFAGGFDGQGHAIHGLIIDRPTETDGGLFRTTEGATVTDVRLIDMSVIGSDDIGGVVRDNERGVIENVSASGNITGISIVGCLVGANDDGTIERWSVSIIINGSDTVGGLAGLIGTNNGGSVENVSASGPSPAHSAWAD